MALTDSRDNHHQDRCHPDSRPDHPSQIRHHEIRHTVLGPDACAVKLAIAGHHWRLNPLMAEKARVEIQVLLGLG